MFKKISCLIVVAILSLACSSKILIEEDKMRHMEVEDHNFCLAQGLGSYNLDMDNQLYWECRTTMAENRIIPNPKIGSETQFNAQMKKVINILELRADRSRNANLARLGSDLETFDHEYCVMQGYSADSIYPEDVEAYYECRTYALMERTTIGPFAIGSYTYQKGEVYKQQADQMPQLRNLRDSKNIDQRGAVLIGSDIENNVYEEAFRVSALVNEYPACSKFKYDSRDSVACINDYEKYNKCIDEIPSKIAKRRLSDTIFCTKQSVKQFPDEIAVYKEGDYATGPKFSKAETVKLRSQFNARCLEDREEKLVLYSNKLPAACKSNVKQWEG